MLKNTIFLLNGITFINFHKKEPFYKRKKNCSTKGKRTVLQKAKELFYKRQKNRSTKGKRTVLQKAKEPFYKRKKISYTKIKKGIIKKKPLYRNKLPKYERKY